MVFQSRGGKRLLCVCVCVLSFISCTVSGTYFLVLERHYILKIYWNLKELLFMWVVSILSILEIKTGKFEKILKMNLKSHYLLILSFFFWPHQGLWDLSS